ncbi:PH domain-containing protein, partial [Streptomyces sp. ID05-47C]|nr:PH domain-containing protein [Streptomyces sp. ID05-47C]
FLGPGGFGGGLSSQAGPDVDEGPSRAESDKAMDELRNLWEARHKEASAQGEVTVRWAWEIMAPAAVGALLLVILVAVG